jgi:hypothetical protein
MIQNPIFIAGLERTGTSLLYATLASHPNIAMTRRTNMWTHFYNQYGDLSRKENFERCLSSMMQYKRLIVLDPNPDRIRVEFWKGESTYGRLFALVEKHYAEKMGKPRWGDKSLNTERYVIPIISAYPDAKIIHIIRDPRDRYASSSTRWKVNRGGVGAAAAMWLSSANLANDNMQRFPHNYQVLRYETLASNPEKTLQEICKFIGEEYVHEMLEMKGARKFRDEGGNSSYGPRRPGVISTSSIGRFREVLSNRAIAMMQILVGQEMHEYKYEQELLQLTRVDWIHLALIDFPLDLSRMIAWKARNAFLNWSGRSLPSYRIVSRNTIK